ncbi:MAG: hypothetical protein V3V78_02480 [Candidatus Woesearchaeota archaeon]
MSKIQIIGDTHEPGSLETMLWFLGDEVYSTGDHIPSGMSGADRKMVDKLRAEGVKDVKPELDRLYKEDEEYRKEVDSDYAKIVANMETRRDALLKAQKHIVSCAGNQDFPVGKKVKEKYGGLDIFKDFLCGYGIAEEFFGIGFYKKPEIFREGSTAIVLVPHDPSYRKDERSYEEIKEGIEKEASEGYNLELFVHDWNINRALILSHQSIDCTLMGLPEGKRDAYTEPGNRALISAYYEEACSSVGSRNVQLVHGHHHTPYMQYEFNGSKVHNLNIGDLLEVDSESGETEVRHIVPY